VNEYLDALEAKLHEMTGVVISWSIRREVDAALGIGFIKGTITFIDNSRLELSEQLPTERQKFRLHYMDEHNHLIVRWDSAPHHKGLGSFPFHKHTSPGVEEQEPITLLEALDVIAGILQL
jgi:hypothetical protein